MKGKFEVFRSTTFHYAVILDFHYYSFLLHHFMCFAEGQVLLLESVVQDCNVRRMIYYTFIKSFKLAVIRMFNTVTVEQNYNVWHDCDQQLIMCILGA